MLSLCQRHLSSFKCLSLLALFLFPVFFHCSLYAMSLEAGKRQFEESERVRQSDPSKAIFLLNQIVHDEELADETDLQLLALESLGFAYNDEGQYDSAIKAVTRLGELALKAQNFDFRVTALLLQGYIYDVQDNYKQAEFYYREGLKLAEGAQDDELISQAYERVSAVQRRQDKYTEALETAQKSVQSLAGSPKTKTYIFALRNLGILEALVGDYNGAIDTLTQSYELSEQRGFQQGVADAVYEIAEVYRKMGNTKLALEYFKLSHEIDVQRNVPLEVANSAFKVGNLSFTEKDYETAQAFAEKAYKLYVEVNNKVGLVISQTLLGQLAYQRGDKAKALELIEAAIVIAKEHNLKARLITTNIAKIKISQQEGDVQAVVLLGEETLQLARALEELEDQMTILNLLAESYQQQDQFEKAFNAFKEATKIKDSLGIKQHNLTLAALQSKAEFKRRQTKIDRLNIEKELQVAKLKENELQLRAWWLGSGCALLIVVLVGYRLYQNRKIAAERAQMLEDVVHKKNQMLADVSHEVRTPLTALYLQIEALQHNIIEDVEGSYEVINRKLADINHLISDIHQLALVDTASLVLNLHEHDFAQVIQLWEREYKQLALVKGFKWNATLDLPQKLVVNWDIDRVKQVLTNLFANSVNYTDLPGSVSFHVTLQDKQVLMVVEDSSPTVDEEHLSEMFERLFRTEASKQRRVSGSGLGLAISKGLVSAHHGSIWAEQSALGGVKMQITLPINPNA